MLKFNVTITNRYEAFNTELPAVPRVGEKIFGRIIPTVTVNKIYYIMGDPTIYLECSSE